MRVGILSGGGDCGGINALIRGAVKRATDYGYEVVGIRRGWAGLLEPDIFSLTYDGVADIVALGGTILLTSRTNPYKKQGGPEQVLSNAKRLGIDYLVVIGGEDTLGVAHRLAEKGLKFVGAPKTIDNDLSETDYTFGFDSAVNVATEAIDRIRTTGQSHERVMVVEVMGRDSGWVATYAGIACGAHLILVPEQPVDVTEVCNLLLARKNSGKHFSLVVVAEGVKLRGLPPMTGLSQKVDEFGHPRLGGVTFLLTEEIEKRTGLETREIVLGHTLRGGAPSAFDRVFATRLGVATVDFIKKGMSDVMPALRGNNIVQVPVRDALRLKPLDMDLLSIGREFS
jgi:6-phosphofructokinase 1